MTEKEGELSCSVCNSLVVLGASESESTPKILACKHRFCKPCLKSRIRIIKQDKLMVVRCPVEGCATITVKDLPKDYVFDKDREKHRFSLVDTAQKLKQKGVHSSRKSGCKSHRKAPRDSETIVETESVDNVSSYSIDNTGARAVVELLVRGAFRGVAILYAVVIVGVSSGLAVGFDIGYSHTLVGFVNQDGKFIYALLLCVLFSFEFVANTSSAKILTQSTFLGSLDFLAIALLGVAALGKLDFGYCHSLDRYLVMFTSKYTGALFVGGLVAVELALLAAHYGAVLVNTISCRLRGAGDRLQELPLQSTASAGAANSDNQKVVNVRKTNGFSPNKNYEFTYMTPSKSQPGEGDTESTNNAEHSTVLSMALSGSPQPSELGSVRKKVDFDLQDYSCGVTPFNSTATSATSVDDESECFRPTVDFTATVASDQDQCGSAQKRMRASVVMAGMHTPTDDTDSDVEVHGTTGVVRYKHGVLDTTPYSISSTDTSIACYSSPAPHSANKDGENDVTLDVFAATTTGVTPSEGPAEREREDFGYGTPTVSTATCVTYCGMFGVGDGGASRDASRNTTAADDQSTHSSDHDHHDDRTHIADLMKPLPPQQQSRSDLYSTYNEASFQSTYNPLCAYSDNPFPATPDYHQQQSQNGRGVAGSYFESPEEEEFKLHSNIKLKPLGSFSGNHSGSNSGNGGDGFSREVRVCELSEPEGEQDLQHTYLLGTTNFSNPGSPTAAAAPSITAPGAVTTAVDAAAMTISSSSSSGGHNKASKATPFGQSTETVTTKVSDLVSSFEKKNAAAVSSYSYKGRATDNPLSRAAKGAAKVLGGKDSVHNNSNSSNNSKFGKGATMAAGPNKATTATGFLGGGLSNLIR